MERCDKATVFSLPCQQVALGDVKVSSVCSCTYVLCTVCVCVCVCVCVRACACDGVTQYPL